MKYPATIYIKEACNGKISYYFLDHDKKGSYRCLNLILMKKPIPKYLQQYKLRNELTKVQNIRIKHRKMRSPVSEATPLLAYHQLFIQKNASGNPRLISKSTYTPLECPSPFNGIALPHDEYVQWNEDIDPPTPRCCCA